MSFSFYLSSLLLAQHYHYIATLNFQVIRIMYMCYSINVLPILLYNYTMFYLMLC